MLSRTARPALRAAAAANARIQWLSRLPGTPRICLPDKLFTSDGRPQRQTTTETPITDRDATHERQLNTPREQTIITKKRENHKKEKENADDVLFCASRVAAVPSSAATYATLREIEDRLKSIRNIEKITNTMKIVASTKLTRAQRAMNDSRQYGQTSNKVYESAETKALEVEDKKTLVIVCSSDKGLCGGIHSSLSRYIRRMQAAQPGFDLVLIGEKAKAQLSRTNAKAIQLSFAGIGKGVPTFADAQAIADQVLQLPTEYTDVKILYNTFVNAQTYEPAMIEAFSEEAIQQSPNFSAFEVDDEALGNLREYGLANSLYWALAEGHACEQSARRNAMDNASKNAGDMISKYQILFNRTRQAVITGELVEIITGATASADM
ncbi:ATPase, F1 complex, gamma subunit domain-containing protein [Fusarium tricinctum]|uniref:ATP synthase subunit gamma, mitochondrial n=1 Tax=Fusarium tricinctum TaxID=61284 RepID=A0A8K0WDI5_9HYPO|nr:ATPase, F1 complex, gamma subunit domain-containing protein [Fusarium tricinctum]